MFHKTDVQRNTVVWWKNHTRSGKLCANPQLANPFVPRVGTDNYRVVCGLEHVLFSMYWEYVVIIIPTDFHIFFRGVGQPPTSRDTTRPVSDGGRHLLQCRHQRVCGWPEAGQHGSCGDCEMFSSMSWDMGTKMIFSLYSLVVHSLRTWISQVDSSRVTILALHGSATCRMIP